MPLLHDDDGAAADDDGDATQVKSLHKGEMGEGGLLGRVSASTNMFLVDGLAR